MLALMGFFLWARVHHMVSPVLGLGLFGASFIAFVTLGIWPWHLEVGTDSIVLRSLHRVQVVPLADIRSVDDQLVGGQTAALRVTLGQAGKSLLLQPWAWSKTVFAMRAAIVLALLRSRENLPVAAGSNLDRAGLDPAQWVAKLRAIGDSAATLRDAPVDREHMLRVVEDPCSPARERAAAAVALSAGADDQDRSRLRAAAGGIADRRVRVVLESAADQASNEALASALDGLDRDEGRLRVAT